MSIPSFRSMRARLIAMTLVILLVVVSLLTTVFARRAAEVLNERWSAQLGQFVEQSLKLLSAFSHSDAAQVTAWTSQPLLRSLAATPAMASILRAGIDAQFDKTLAASPWIADIQMIGDGRVVYSRRDLAATFDESLWVEAVAALPEQRLAALDLQAYGAATVVLVWKSAAVADVVPAKHLVIFYDMALLSRQLFADQSFDGSGFVSLTAPLGGRLRLALPAAAIDPALAALESGSLPWATTAAVPPLWSDLVLRAARLSPGDIGVIAVLPVATVQEPVRRFVHLAVGFGALAAGLGLLITLLFAEAISRPIRRLTAKVQDFSHGDLAVRVDETRRDELGTLARTFNGMAARLERRTRELNRNVALLAILEQENRAIARALSTAELLGQVETAVLHLSRELQCRVEIYQPLLTSVSDDAARSWLEISSASGHRRRLAWPLSNATIVADDMVLFPCMSSGLGATSPHGLIVIGVERREGSAGGAGVAEERAAIDRIFRAFALAIHGALQTIANLELIREHARTQGEIEAAQAVQEALLPQSLPTERVRISASYKPANYIGGDWYGNYYDEQSRVLYFYIGDITGHSFSSALLTGVVYGSIHAANAYFSREHTHSDTEEHLSNLALTLNSVVRASGHGRLMMTFMAIALSLDTGELLCLNAGHRPALRVRHSSGRAVESITGQPSPMLGLDDHPQYVCRRYQVDPDDIICMYTDGLVENLVGRGQGLRWRQLRECLTSADDVDQVKDSILAATHNLWDGMQPEDDTTLLLFKWTG